MSAAEPRDRSTPAAGRRRPLRVFVVENNVDTRVVLGMLLEQLGHTTANASSVAEALDELRGRPYDVLVSDIGLPDGTGWDLMARLADARPPYAVAMSGFGSVQDRERSRKTGFRHHLLKPVEPGQIETLLDEAADIIGDRNGDATREGETARTSTGRSASDDDAGPPSPSAAVAPPGMPGDEAGGMRGGDSRTPEIRNRSERPR